LYYKEISFEEAWEIENNQIVIRTKLHESDGSVIQNLKISGINVFFINFNGKRAVINEGDTMFTFYKKMDSGIYKEV